MAVIANTNPTLADWKAALGPDNKIATLINLLEQTNDILLDMTFQEANEATSHLHNIATGLPNVTRRRLYQGAIASKGSREQVRDSVGWYEDFQEIDSKLVKLDGNGQMLRAQEAMLQMEAMSQQFAKDIFYGNPAVDDTQIGGLSMRYNTTNENVAKSARNVIDAKGTGADNASIWLINWGPKACFGIVAKGSEAGLTMEDLGRKMIQDYNGVQGSRLMMHVARFEWNVGLALGDWRYCARIANIDRSTLTSDASSGANLPVLMKKAIRKTPRRRMFRPAFYMDQSMIGFFEEQLSAAVKNSTLTRDQVGGNMTTSWDGIPIRQCDALENDEARVV